MSTQSLQPAWKQEINQRIAAHKNRKGAGGISDRNAEAPESGSSRAAEAAARVAARYAKAPSYSQMQAEEARVAVRAAEIATKVAIEAQAAAESALAEMHAASGQTMRGPAVIETIQRTPRVEVEERAPELAFDWEQEAPAAEAREATISAAAARPAPPELSPVVTTEVIDGKSFDLHWEPDIPARAIQMPSPTLSRNHDEFELSVEDWWTPAQVNAALHSEPIEIDAESSHANLIEFPRELVAARKMRPRLAEAVAGVLLDPEGQLSIFEVDPGAMTAETAAAQHFEPLQNIMKDSVWSGIELDAHPVRQEAPSVQATRELRPFLAPLGLRLMAMAVDGALILAVFFACALWVTSKMAELPAVRTAEMIVVAGLLLTGFGYYWAFFKMAGTTPGMRYAGIALCTFNNEVPTEQELRFRLRAMALSLLPVGIGIVWAVFDEDHLSWHDRISGTYLRKR